MKKKNKMPDPDSSKKENLPGYPQYPESEDIYNNEKERQYMEEDNPEINEDNKREESLGQGLDVPGAELDDAEEVIGEEDEENNYYSLGGDDHNDLEEDKGE